MSAKSYIYPASDMVQHRNMFDLSHQHKMSFNHGDLVILTLIPVVPGDTLTLDVSSFIRMSTPIAPIMDNIHMHIAAYYSRNRDLFENWEQLMGANKTGAWTADDNAYQVPVVQSVPSVGTIGDDLGLNANMTSYGPVPQVSALPGRMYYEIWNYHYRNQNVSAPIPVDKSSSNNIVASGHSLSGSQYNAGHLKLAKFADIFTKCLPEPQKHDPVPFIPEDIKVGAFSSYDGNLSTSYPYYAGFLGADVNPLTDGKFVQLKNIVSNTGAVSSRVGEVVANVQDTWNTINSLRFAFQLQKFYEKDARAGTIYRQMINYHYGVNNGEIELGMPEFLGETNFRINIDQVLSTAGYDAGQSTTVGAPGANSVTGNKSSLFTKSFTDFGYVMLVGGTRHDHTYSSAVDEHWFQLDRLDFYDPVFANIGEQPIYRKNIAANFPDPNTIFGYQEAWAYMRFMPDKVTGILNPSRDNSLDFWTLADKFDSAPILNEEFIYENRNSISRALVTGSTGPDYIADFYFKVKAARPLPLFSIPGLADHH